MGEVLYIGSSYTNLPYIYRISTVYQPCIYRISTVIYSEKIYRVIKGVV